MLSQKRNVASPKLLTAHRTDLQSEITEGAETPPSEVTSLAGWFL